MFLRRLIFRGLDLTIKLDYKKLRINAVLDVYVIVKLTDLKVIRYDYTLLIFKHNSIKILVTLRLSSLSHAIRYFEIADMNANAIINVKRVKKLRYVIAAKP